MDSHVAQLLSIAWKAIEVISSLLTTGWYA